MLAAVIVVAALTTSVLDMSPTSATPGDTWIAQTAAEANTWFSVTYGNGLFVAVSFGKGTHRVMTSGTLGPAPTTTTTAPKASTTVATGASPATPVAVTPSFTG
jgi:hypothetical protein